MSERVKIFLIQFSYSFGTNAISFLVSIGTTFIIPTVLNETEYGYWQLYLFYTSYVGIFHLGWNDGLYLRYGGKKYSELDRDTFHTQFIFELILQTIIAGIVIFMAYFFINGPKEQIIYYVVFCMIIINLRCMLIYILQMTGKVKEYAIVNTIDRVSFLLLIFLLIFCKKDNFSFFVYVDIISKLLSFTCSLLICKDIIFTGKIKFDGIFVEIHKNITVGIHLMIANLASMMIIGIVRLGIEHTWSIETFGKISLTISISNFLIIFINSVGIVIYPMLKNLSSGTQRDVFKKINGLFPFMYITLFLFYPLKEIIKYILPQYEESIRYIALLFPICIYEGKMSLLYITYLKTLRRERALLYINLIVMVISVASTLISTKILYNLDVTVFSITALLYGKSLLCELYLLRTLQIPKEENVVWELLFLICFTISNIYFSPLKAAIAFGIVYLLFLFRKFRYSTLKIL